MEDFFATLNKTATQTKITQPVSALPKIWIGYIFAGTFLLAEIIEAYRGYVDKISPLLILISLSGIAYWMFCIHRFHKILNQMDISYEITPGMAVGYHFIPFFNFYWIFKWPSVLSRFINIRGNIKIVSGSILGFLLLMAYLINGYIDSAIGLAFIFGIGMYITKRLHHEIQKAETHAEIEETCMTELPNKNSDQREVFQDTNPEFPQSKTKTLCNPTNHLVRGSTFAGRYQIIEELGIGGRGRVYKAYDLDLEEKVALKLIKPEIAADENTIQRFRNELKIARKIAHKNVCRMFDLGKEGDNYYISMEYVSGEDLKSTVRRVGPLSTGKAIFIAKQVCHGLSEAHRQGIIHRDLKPQNIMIDREGNVRVMDFGIARSMEAKGLTEDGLVMGTPEYMAPEQVEGRKADKRSDIYSMGVILYELMTGQVPFDGLTPMSVASKHLTKRPREPRELNSQVPINLSEVIMRCMEKEKGRRYQNIEELLFRLTEIEKGMPSTDTIKPERKPITSKEITISFNLRKLLIPVSLVATVIMIGVLTWKLVLNPKTEKEFFSSAPSKEEALSAEQNHLIDEDSISPASKNPDPDKPKKITATQEAQPVPAKKQEAPVVKPKSKEKDQRKMDILAILDKGIESFNHEQYEECIKQMEEVLRTDAGNESAQHYLAEAIKKNEIKITQEEIAHRIHLSQAAYQSGDYQECLRQSKQVLSLDPKNSEAKKYSDLANVKIIPGQIGNIIQLYIQSINENMLNNFYQNRCSATLYQKLREEVELISSQFDNFEAQASDITLRFKENDRMEVRFANITTGVSKKDKSRQVIFEGTYFWELEKKEGRWKIIDIKIQNPDRFQPEFPQAEP